MEPRTHTDIYLGHSSCHVGSVALVLNLKTGLVSLQFHVVYKDEFTTFCYISSALVIPLNWTAPNEYHTERDTDE